MKLKNLFLFFILGTTLQIGAQNLVSSQVDSTRIKIGSAFNLTIKANAEQGAGVVFPDSKTIGPFEVIATTPIDTILKDRKMELIKKYTLTQFDSGSYAVPRLSVLINGKNYQTDVFDVTVTNVTVDTLKQPMYDIKANLGSSTDISILKYYIMALLLCIGLGLLTRYIIKKRQEKTLTEDDLFKTPLEKVTKKLQLLDEKRLIIDGNIKVYYSEMTDIVRDYIEEVFEIPAKESTTEEVIKYLQKNIKERKVKLSKETINDLKRVLQNADLVKFAKSEPMISEIESDRKVVGTVSENINQVITKFSDEQSERVKVRERRFNKRKRIRTWVPIAVTAFCILLTGSFYLYQSVMQGMKFEFLQSNKSLFEKEDWIESAYGFPSIKLKTPEVLIRVENKEAKKEDLESKLSSFAYANLKTNLTISVNTTSIKNTEEIKIEDLYEQKLRLAEQALGAKNIKSEKEAFNQNGINGLRGSGTFTIVNPVTNEAQNMQFETYLFIQKNGVQEVNIMYKDQDEYGIKIARRIIESIQLSVTNE